MSKTDDPRNNALKILQRVAIEFQKDTIAEWQNPAGKNSDMIVLANAFAQALLEKIESNEKKIVESFTAETNRKLQAVKDKLRTIPLSEYDRNLVAALLDKENY